MSRKLKLYINADSLAEREICIQYYYYYSIGICGEL